MCPFFITLWRVFSFVQIYLSSIETHLTYSDLNLFERIPLESKNGFEFLRIHEIQFIQSDGNYIWVKLQNGAKKFYCCSLAKAEKLLSRYNCFYRIHNSYIVNINQIKSYLKGDGGEVVFEDFEKLPVSRNRKSGFLQWVYQGKIHSSKINEK